MLTLISPAKTLNEKIETGIPDYTIPEFLNEAEIIINLLKTFSTSRLMKLMDINPKLAELNALRFNRWSVPFQPDNAKPAVLVFNGEVYNGLRANTLKASDLKFAQDHLRILSGLYGILRPLDIIKAYRLEMGTNLKVGKIKDLYAFWGIKLTETLNRELSGHREKVILNLASKEYFAALNPKKLDARILTCTFKEERNGKYQFVTIFGKKARGLMSRFMIQNRIDKAEDLKHFDEEGYFFNERISTKEEWIFTR